MTEKEKFNNWLEKQVEKQVENGLQNFDIFWAPGAEKISAEERYKALNDLNTNLEQGNYELVEFFDIKASKSELL